MIDLGDPYEGADPRLAWMLRVLSDEFGTLGVLATQQAAFDYLSSGGSIDNRLGPQSDEPPEESTPEELQCGAWGGCDLPRGHNMGRPDIPENHRGLEQFSYRPTRMDQEAVDKANSVEETPFDLREDWTEVRVKADPSKGESPRAQEGITVCGRGVKSLRETIARAQTQVQHSALDPKVVESDIARLQEVADACDRARPIGPDGKHGDRHTECCGCDDLVVKAPHSVCHRPIGPMTIGSMCDDCGHHAIAHTVLGGPCLVCVLDRNGLIPYESW